MSNIISRAAFVGKLLLSREGRGLLNAAHGEKALTSNVLQELVAGSAWFQGLPLSKLGDFDSYLKAATRKVWALWTCCDLIAESACSQDHVVRRKRGKVKLDIDSSAADYLLEEPNEWQTWRDLKYHTLMQLLICGNAFWAKDEASVNGDRPKRLIPLNPKRMSIIIDVRNGVIGYVYRPVYAQDRANFSQPIPFEPHEIVHFRKQNPDNDFWGLGAVEAGENLFNDFINEDTWRQRFWGRGALPTTLLTLKSGVGGQPTSIPEAKWKEMKANWQQEYGGTDNAGKCLGPNVQVMMFNGTSKPAWQVEKSEYLMGPDGKARLVTHRNDGFGPMVRIVPSSGEPWECNTEHILVLEQSVGPQKGRQFEMSVEQFEALPEYRKDQLLLRKAVLDYKEQPVPVDPRAFGLWLGDGKTGYATLYAGEKETKVREYWKHYWTSLGMTVNERWERTVYRLDVVTRLLNGKQPNGHTAVRVNHLFKEKRIPSCYFINTKKVRLELLAGLIDSDGSASRTCFEYATILDGLKDDVVRLANGLGFRCTVRRRMSNFNTPSWRIHISGDTHQVPTLRKKTVKSSGKGSRTHGLTGFDIQHIGNGTWSGWTLDGDGRFLLADGTITHNTAWLSGDWAVQRIGLSLAEMQSIEGRRWTVEQIAHQFKVPLSVLGLDSAANYATASIDRRRFLEFAVLPTLKNFQERVNKDLIRGFDETLTLEHDVSGLVSLDELAGPLQTLISNSVITPNEARQVIGKEKVDDPAMDRHYMTSGLIPLELNGVADLGSVDAAAQRLQQRVTQRELKPGAKQPKPGKPVAADKEDEEDEKE